ncbi:hypothetical protein CVU83_03435 [Candidatus Falkowbacteria bacterium HGW-Falkowbacteria-2]|uniref:Uncharacterized protein n=1 Tax=Candidatus Falkowbacteria bacterium HGW-Falkowbacteria-2 TaxID=2013769 RepID=A0A2N2DX71_9BACT|nr:MAG: hypothetical protein CVU83_03435 [Candidatus Falkowbacteria bacterium HGW-Falkowbacteria-2]
MKYIYSRRILFFSILALIFIVAAFVPQIINGSILGFGEEASETIIIGGLLIAAFLINSMCFKEYWRLHRYQVNLEDRLQDTFKYIGSVNLQMEEMRQAFTNFKKYPENKKDIRTVFVYFAEKILSMVNTDWVIIRVIDMKTGRTIREDKFARNNQAVEYGKIENNEIISGKCKDDRCTIVKSEQENINIKAYCILSAKLNNKDQEFFVRSIINQLEMMYIVFSSLNKNTKTGINNGESNGNREAEMTPEKQGEPDEDDEYNQQ